MTFSLDSANLEGGINKTYYLDIENIYEDKDIENLLIFPLTPEFLEVESNLFDNKF